MFGKHLEPAEATVLYAEMLSADTHSSWHTYEFILDVRTATGQVFRATKKQEFLPFEHPKVGDVIKVKYNPKNMKVEMDLKGDVRYDTKAQNAQTKARHDALLSSPPGTPFAPNPLPGQFNAGELNLNEVFNKAFANGATVIQSTQSEQFGAGGLNLNEILSQAFANGKVVQMGGMAQAFTTNGQPQAQAFTTNGQPQAQSSPAQQAFDQSLLLHADLQNSGVTGTATVLHIEETGMTFPPFVAQKIMARIQEASGYQFFDCTFTAWIDPRKTVLSMGNNVTVRYDPTNHDRIIIQH